MRTRPATQHELALGAGGRRVRAVIGEVGAALRHLSIGGVALTPDLEDDSEAPFFCGKVLVPWPNRVRDGRWAHGGQTLQLGVNDPVHNTALHGLVHDAAHRPIARSASAVTLAAAITPKDGYPFRLDTEVTYRLVTDGLMTTHTIRNAGSASAPVALGAHPFLTIGDVPVETLTLVVDGTRHVNLDHRRIPVGEAPVHGSRWDLRSGRVVTDLDLDDSWSVRREPGGGSRHTLRAPDGRTVALEADHQFGFVHVFITREFPVGGRAATAVAIEPMTAPANALNNGVGLRWLRPGAAFRASWAIRYRGSPR